MRQTASAPASAETELTTQLRTAPEHGARVPHTAAALGDAGLAAGQDNAPRFGIDGILDGPAVLIAARA